MTKYNPSLDTQIEEILDVLIMGYCPELIGDINKSFQYYTEAHKAIKALLIQSKIDELEMLLNDSEWLEVRYDPNDPTSVDHSEQAIIADTVSDRIASLKRELK